MANGSTVKFHCRDIKEETKDSTLVTYYISSNMIEREKMDPNGVQSTRGAWKKRLQKLRRC